MEEDFGGQIFPDEVCEEILKFEPLIDLGRSTSVCRVWNELISSGRFQKKHRTQQVREGRFVAYLEPQWVYRPLFYQGSFASSPPIRIINWGDEARVQMLCSCLGLVCYATVDDDIFICNLATGKRFLTPPWPIAFLRPTWNARVYYGMGYVAKQDDYMIVRVAIYVGDVFESSVDVYSRNKKSWAMGGPFHFRFPVECPGIFVSGRVHWLVSEVNVNDYIGWLNVEDMSTGRMEISTLGFNGPKTLRIDHLNDSTLVIYNTYCRDDGVFRIWVLNEYDNQDSWKCYDIVLPRRLMTVQPDTHLQPVRFANGCTYEILFRLNPQGTYVCFNTRTNALTERGRIGGELQGPHTMFKYVECFEDPERAFPCV